MTASERVKKWRAANPAAKKSLDAAYRKRNADAIRLRHRLWESKPENQKKIRDRRRTRFQNDPAVRAEKSLRVRMRAAVRAVGARKAYRSEKLFGAAPRVLRTHLESLFRLGMSWDNYGTVWHIDHIKPCARFDLSDPAQQLRCFHYTNLQPLFVKENQEKADSYEI